MAFKYYNQLRYPEIPYGSGTVEALAHLPRQSLLPKLLLQVAGRKVNAYCHCIIISVGESGRDSLSQATDTDHDFRLVVDASHIVWHKERFAVLEQRRISLGEYYRVLSFI